MSNVIEATKFRLKEGITLEVFLAANQQVNEWVQAQAGFQSRFLTQKEDAGWLDILIWENESVASEIDALFSRIHIDTSALANIIDAFIISSFRRCRPVFNI